MSHFKGPEIPNLHIRSTSSVLKTLHKALESHGQETALVDGETGITISYSGILKQSVCIAAGLRSRGVTAGQVVVVCCEKSILAFSTLLGVMFTGATAALVPTPNGDIIPQLCKGHAVKAIIYDTDNHKSVSKSVAALTPEPSLVFTADPHDPLMSSLLNSSDDFSVYEVPDPETHVSIVLYTSGTTGVPKGIELTDAIVQNTVAQSSHKDFSSQACFSPLYWISSLFMWLTALHLPRRLILSKSRDTRVNLQLVEQYQIESLFVGQGPMYRFAFEQSRQPFDLSSLKRVFTGGETLLENPVKGFIEKVLKNKLKLEVMYGATEAAALTYNSDHTLVDSNKVLSSGKVLPGAELKIVGEDGEIVPLGSTGEIWARSVNMTTGYWNKPELNDQLFEDGFLQTGDIGYFDEDGNLYVLGRVEDAIHFNESKLFPTKVENELLSHEAVLEAAVVGVSPPSPPLLDAYVVLKPGAQVSKEQLRAHVNGKMELRQRLTGRIHFLDALPRTTLGKTLRSKLQEATFSTILV